MKTSSVKKNFMYQVLYEMLVIMLPFVTSPYIARVIGAEGLGKYSYSYSIAYYFVLFAMLGIKNYGNRAIAQSRDIQEDLNEVFSNILCVHIIFSVICCIFYFVYAFNVKEDKLYAIIQGAYVLSALFDISWFYFGIEKFKLTVTRNTVIKVLNVVCVFVFVKGSQDLWKYCAIMSVGMLISQISLWVPLGRYVKFVKPKWKKMIMHIKPLLILFIPAVAISLYKYMDKIMIGSLSDKTQLGYYENAEKVISVPMSIISSFGMVMLPKMSNLAKAKDKVASSKYMNVSMRYVMCLAYALAFGIAGVGKVFAPVFWGKEFQCSGIIIMGLAVTIPFIAFANIIRTQYLIPVGKDKEYLTSVICGAIINLIVNVLLIPEMGARGATIGTIFAEVVVCGVQCIAVRKELPIGTYIKKSLYFVCVGVLMFITVYCVGNRLVNGSLTLFVQVILGIVIYGTCTFVYLFYVKDTIFLKLLENMGRKKF